MRRRSIVIAVFVPALLTAQQPDDAVMAFQRFTGHYGRVLVAAFDSIPERSYGYHPSPPQQSIGYIAQHVEAANYGLCNRFVAIKHRLTAKDSLSDSIKARWPKDTLVARLRSSLAFCDTAISRMTDTQLSSGPATPSNLLAFATDLAEHYAQVASYMRQLGLTPPTALAPAQRIAIDLPASSLSGFVGIYDLPASHFSGSPALVLDVHVRDGGLYLTPNGQPEARLWPSSQVDFFFKEIDAQITFTRGGNGTVTGLTVHQYGEDRVARRRPGS